MITFIVFYIGSCKLDLAFYRPLLKSFLQNPSSPNPLLSSAGAAEVAEENLSFFFFSNSFFLFFSSRVKWKETKLMAGVWRPLLCHRNWETLCLVLTRVGQEPQFLLGKTISWCFWYPLTSSLICWDCSQGSQLQRTKAAGPAGRRPAPPTISQQKHCFLYP